MKYHEQLALADAFADKLLQRINPDTLPDYVIRCHCTPPSCVNAASINLYCSPQNLHSGTIWNYWAMFASVYAIPAAISFAVEGTQKKRAQCVSLRCRFNRQASCLGG